MGDVGCYVFILLSSLMLSSKFSSRLLNEAEVDTSIKNRNENIYPF
jgi:hypothetical protein